MTEQITVDPFGMPRMLRAVVYDLADDLATIYKPYTLRLYAEPRLVIVFNGGLRSQAMLSIDVGSCYTRESLLERVRKQAGLGGVWAGDQGKPVPPPDNGGQVGEGLTQGHQYYVHGREDALSYIGSVAQVLRLHNEEREPLLLRADQVAMVEPERGGSRIGLPAGMTVWVQESVSEIEAMLRQAAPITQL